MKSDDKIREYEAGKQLAGALGPVCGCRDLQPCGCQVHLPAFARVDADLASFPASTEKHFVEACDLMLELVREVNRLAYPLPREVAIRVNQIEDFIRSKMPVPF